MKKILLTLIVLLSITSTSYAMQTDKVAHFGVGYVINSELHKHTKLTFLERLGCVMIVGAAKELTDKHWDGKDFLATCSGALVYEIKF